MNASLFRGVVATMLLLGASSVFPAYGANTLDSQDSQMIWPDGYWSPTDAISTGTFQSDDSVFNPKKDCYVCASPVWGSNNVFTVQPPQRGWTVDHWRKTTATCGFFDAVGSPIPGSAKLFSIAIPYESTATVHLGVKFRYLTYSLAYDKNAEGATGGMSPHTEVSYPTAFSLTDNAFSRVGYTFSHWTDARGVAYADGAAIASGEAFGLTYFDTNLTLKAQWTANTYSVTLDPAGGSVTPTTLSVTYDGTYSLPEPQRYGYIFGGWWTALSDGTQVRNGDAVKTTADLTLYARWTVGSYTVVFNGNGATAGDASDQSFHCDEKKALAANPFTRAGSAFVGWSTDPAATDAMYADGEQVENLAKNGATIVLFAVWHPLTYTIVFNANGGSGSMAPQECSCENELSLSTNEFTKTGYTFAGWAETLTDATQLIVAYTNAAPVKNLAASDETKDLFAVWATNTYTIVFEPNTPSSVADPGTMEPQVFVYDEPQALCANAFSSDEMHAFACWSNTVSGLTYADGASVVNLTAENHATNTFVAIWKISVGDYSEALGCDNLRWSASSCWTINGSIVSHRDKVSGYHALETTSIRSSGTLTFEWKVSYDDSLAQIRLTGAVNSGTTKLTATAADVWQTFGPFHIDYPQTPTQVSVSIEHDSQGTFEIPRTPDDIFEIRNLRWVPDSEAGVEPTEADAVTVSQFETTASGFNLSFAGQTDFDYALRGTNSLTAPWPWPVLETKPGAAAMEFEIVIDPAKPQMFYRIETQKKSK